jgi:SAM-dependent methyltransferase
MICGGEPEKTKFWYRKPDKYEKYVMPGLEKLENIKRMWVKCKKCGFYWQIRNYPLEQLTEIYKFDYRSECFRGEWIDQTFERIMGYKNSENDQRYEWFWSHTQYIDSVLDIGSGLGVWPALLYKKGYSIVCTEENEISRSYINSRLGFGCYKSLDDVGELIHVLEHIEDVNSFLTEVRAHLKPQGILFVEVPDNIEFLQLDKDHDEFNSCHLWHFDIESLCRVMKRNKFNPRHIGRLTYDARGLSRILMICD